MNLNVQTLQQLSAQNLPMSSSMPSASGLNMGGLQQGASAPPSNFADLMNRMQGARTGNPHPARVPAIVQDRELFELTLELEGILVQNLIRGMRNTIQRTNLIDTGFAGQIYEDMLFDEYARIVTRNASFGFAEMAYRQLTGQR
ncbi:MAG: rod-binding protein [Treponema sp.]|jgi:flagellar protein FlgJ|nr:rod-binding protein [Treponema sp.]